MIWIKQDDKDQARRIDITIFWEYNRDENVWRIVL